MAMMDKSRNAAILFNYDGGGAAPAVAANYWCSCLLLIASIGDELEGTY